MLAVYKRRGSNKNSVGPSTRKAFFESNKCKNELLSDLIKNQHHLDFIFLEILLGFQQSIIHWLGLID